MWIIIVFIFLRFDLFTLGLHGVGLNDFFYWFRVWVPGKYLLVEHIKLWMHKR